MAIQTTGYKPQITISNQSNIFNPTLLAQYGSGWPGEGDYNQERCDKLLAEITRALADYRYTQSNPGFSGGSLGDPKQKLNDLIQEHLDNCKDGGDLMSVHIQTFITGIKNNINSPNQSQFNAGEWKTRFEALLQQAKTRPKGKERLIRAINTIIFFLSPVKAPLKLPTPKLAW